MKEIDITLPEISFPFDTDDEAYELYGLPFSKTIRYLYENVCDDICCSHYNNVSDCEQCPIGCLIIQASQYDNDNFWINEAKDVDKCHANRKKKAPEFYRDMPEMYPENNFWERIAKGER